MKILQQNQATQNKNMGVVTYVTEGHCNIIIKNKTPEKSASHLSIIITIYKISLICYNIISNGRYEDNEVVMAFENYNFYINFMKIHSPIFQNELRKAGKHWIMKFKFYTTTFL